MTARVRAPRERLTVLAIGREQVVALAKRLGGADDRRLLADAEVEEAADLRLRVHLAGALLEAPDQEHLLEHREAGLPAWQRVRGRLRREVLRRRTGPLQR